MAVEGGEIGLLLDNGCLSYKELYHASVERSWNLQEQLKKYSGLLLKHQRIAKLKDETVASLAKNKALVDVYYRNLMEKEQDWKEKLANSLSREKMWEQRYMQLQAECEAKELYWTRVCGKTLARIATAKAESRSKNQLLEEADTRKKSEVEKAKKKFSSYAQALMAKYTAVKESLEFAEAERAALIEANAEAETRLKSQSAEADTRLKSLTAQLEEKSLSLEEAKAELRSQVSPPLPPPTPSITVPEPCSSCEQCQQLSRQLGVAIDALNNRGCAKYGDLLHSKFTLEQKLSAIVLEHQRLGDYIQEYKERSVEKVGILKENIEKADREIAELDKLVELVREALHSNMDLVGQSPQLLRALEEIEGTNKNDD